MKIKLPAIDQSRKWKVAAMGYATFCLLYTFAGATPFRSPAVLNASKLDELIPFISWTVWIYMAQLFFLFFSVMALKRASAISRALYSMGLASALSFAIFFIYPTTLPRGPASVEGLTGEMFEFLHLIDSSANCLPSLHISLAWLAAAGVFEEHKRKAAVAIIFAALVSLSTMTTKQHYFIDVVAGVGVAALCRLAVARIDFTGYGSSAGS